MCKHYEEYSSNKQWEYENGFYLTSHITRIAKLVSQYELYKSIIDLPGHIVECGVYKGASFIRFATFREILESPYSRKIIGFDIFGAFPPQDDAQDTDFISTFESISGPGIPIATLEDVLHDKHFVNYELVQGDIIETIPDYIGRHPELKIALLHIDVDVYKPTAVILTNLFEKVVKGGLIVLDDYATVSGETRAIDEFFAAKKLIIQKHPFAHVPAFIRITE